MIDLQQLRYVRLNVTDLAESARFVTRVLGLEPVDATAAHVTFRSDERDYTLALCSGGAVTSPAIGLEVRYSRDLDAANDMLRARNLSTGRGTSDECALRKVKDLLWFVDHSGNRYELVVRPLNSGWRYFPSRDAGVRGLSNVLVRSTDVEKDVSLWTEIFNTSIRDWAGDTAYLGFDEAHHRMAIFPARKAGVLGIEYSVEDVNLLMRNNYALRDFQVPVLHGPGRRPTSGQVFLTFSSPLDVLFSFVAEGAVVTSQHRPRQFAAGPQGLCEWGSDCRVDEFLAPTRQ